MNGSERRAAKVGGLVATPPAIRTSAGRTKSSKQTSVLTGFPGNPNTGFTIPAGEVHTPNQSGFPGLRLTL
ncbi:MAG: hypothetical protein C0483_06860 [Pirellula sp.]|nr:hypothetical protein [Pirellula sp.]